MAESFTSPAVPALLDGRMPGYLRQEPRSGNDVRREMALRLPAAAVSPDAAATEQVVRVSSCSEVPAMPPGLSEECPAVPAILSRCQENGTSGACRPDGREYPPSLP